MYCPNCGAKNDDYAAGCVSCGVTLLHNESTQYNQDVPNYLVWSILVTVLCCIPLGIPAIVYSAQVDTRLRLGDYQGAVDASQKAKTFCWISFGLGGGIILIYSLLMLAGLFSSL